MDSANTDKETIRAAMMFTSAVIVFVSTMAGIINSKLEKAKSVAQKERIISIAINLANVGCVILGSIVMIGFDSFDLGACIFLGPAFINIYRFLAAKTTPSRSDILALCTSVAAIFFIIAGSLIMHLTRVIGHIVDVIGKMVK